MLDPFAIAFMTSQREQLRALLLWLDAIPEASRPSVRAGCIQALGAIEDALNIERTFPRREVRRQIREFEQSGP